MTASPLTLLNIAEGFFLLDIAVSSLLKKRLGLIFGLFREILITGSILHMQEWPFIVYEYMSSIAFPANLPIDAYLADMVAGQ